MTEKEKLFMLSWDKQRKNGKWSFALRIGVLWALVSYALMQCYYVVFEEGYVFETGRFLTGLAVWVIMGFFGFGLIMWWLNERVYHKINIKNPE
jgi:hypothetical protein